MFENLKIFEKRYEELGRRLYDPSVVSDPAAYRDAVKEYKSIEPIVDAYRAYRKTLDDEADALSVLEDGEARDLRGAAEEELSEARAERERLAGELKILLLPKDPNDERDVIVEIRAGAGGEEAALFSAVLYRMYAMYAQRRGWKTEILNANETELGGFREISFAVAGAGAYSRLKYESGVHRVQRVPDYTIESALFSTRREIFNKSGAHAVNIAHTVRTVLHPHNKKTNPKKRLAPFFVFVSLLLRTILELIHSIHSFFTLSSLFVFFSQDPQNEKSQYYYQHIHGNLLKKHCVSGMIFVI